MIPEFAAGLGALRLDAQDFATTGLTLAAAVAPEGLLSAIGVLDKEGFLLEDVMAVDIAEGFELDYHLSRLDRESRVVLRLVVPHETPDVPSISAIYPGADWHERECFDFYGINFLDHPNLHYLLLPEDADIHPLVKAPGDRRSQAELLPYLAPEADAPAPAGQAAAKPAPDAASGADNA